ncbi:MAG: hypothetical protein OXI44_03185 [Bacteroidota bacterium]|nr:hypothetical protein [Bacteroidota bacterium]
MARRGKMTFIVDRTVSQIQPDKAKDHIRGPYPLQDLAPECSYVLLGEPGMGKTTEFTREADRVGGLLIPVRRFINLDPENHPEWRERTLYLDGLDEARVGSGSPRDVIYKVISQLEALGTPRFRLSCRSNGWLGINDLSELASLLAAETVKVLQLNPLDYDDVWSIVSNFREDAGEFIQQAKQHGIEAFLWNPQLLSILLKSVQTGGWRNSPSEVFENACRELVTERNQEYLAVHSYDAPPSWDVILNSAGQLSALMLIANKTGWSIDYAKNPEILSLRDVDEPNRDVLRSALDSKVFEGGLTCRVPLHRLLTEYLGGLYLHKKINSGLSVRRALSLLMGHDGVPFPDLRGLAAWLATLNNKVRPILINADPVALAFNGDSSSLSLEQRRKLLENLERKIDSTHVRPSTAALGALAGNQGRSLIWELIDSPVRSSRRQILVYELLRGVHQIRHRVGMNDQSIPDEKLKNENSKLLQVVYDRSWNGSVRRQALRLLNWVLMDTLEHGRILRKILEDLVDDRLMDEENSLLGIVLEFLYPGELPPSKVWNYLLIGSVEDSPPTYLYFWTGLVARSNEEQIKELIDSLCNQASKVIPKLARFNIVDIVLKLLARGLELSGDKLDLTELYDWFELVEFDDHSFKLVPTYSSEDFIGLNDHDASQQIHDWLECREEILYALIKHDLITQESKIASDNTIGLKFVGTNAPIGFRSWCLARAAKLWDRYPIAAERLAWWSVWIWQGWGEPLSDDEAEETVLGIPGLRDWNSKRLRRRDQDEQVEAARTKAREKRLAVFQERRQNELEPIRRQKNELAKGRCSPQLLDHLAHIYFSGSINQDESPRTSLESYMNGDQSLVQAALEGFRSLLDRDDLPVLDEIAKLHENNRRSYFARPFLAGIQEEECETATVLRGLNDEGIRRLLGFYLVTDIPRLNNRIASKNGNFNCFETWLDQALTQYPEAMADSLVAIHNACVRAKLPPNRHLNEMAFNRAYSRVAQLAVGRMFSVFPTRCNERQLESLRVVLWSVILAGIMSAEDLRKIVLKRLDRKKIDIGQMAYWLCAGLSVARDHCLPLLIDFLSAEGESRVRHVFDFLVTSGSREFIFRDMSDWQPGELSTLIQMLGKRGQNLTLQEGPYLLGTKEGMIGHLSPLTPWVLELGRRSDDNAAEAIAQLVADPNLVTWRQEIRRAQESQAWNSRMAKRLDFSIVEIQETLQNGSPASAADLAALTTDVLEELADYIRNGQTNEWRQYWDWDHKTKKPTHPKDENNCRDVLLSDLKGILHQYNIDAQPEGRYADEKRADIRISYGSYLSVPIEIKKNSHRKIWHGVSEQLVPKYTRDPNSDGHGIYLVLWFGADRTHMKMLSPSGGVPKKPEELKSMLVEQLEPAFSNRISVVVIDVSLSSKYSLPSNTFNVDDKTFYSDSAPL